MLSRCVSPTLLAALLLAGPASARAGPPAGSARPLPAVAAAVAEARAAAAAFRDVTCTLHKTEYKGGPLPAEQVLLKLRNRPRAVYMRWVGPERNGQEVVWREGWNGGKLRAHRGSFPDFSVSLSPTGWLAMRGTRHPVTHVGFDTILAALDHDVAIAEARPECVVGSEDLGVQDVHGAPARCFDFRTDKARCADLYAYRARFCLDEATRLPTRVEVWDLADGEVRLVEQFAYQGLRLDGGLGDADFDPGRYGF